MKTISKILAILMLVGLMACHNDEPAAYDVEQVRVQLTGEGAAQQGIGVRLTDSKGMEFVQMTDAQGVATFQVPVGIYQATVSWWCAATTRCLSPCH